MTMPLIKEWGTMKEADLLMGISIRKAGLRISLLDRKSGEFLSFELDSNELRHYVTRMASKKKLIRILALAEEAREELQN